MQHGLTNFRSQNISKKDKSRKTYIAHTFLKDKTKKIEIFLVNSRKTENRSQNRGQTQVWPVWPVPPPLVCTKIIGAVESSFF